MARMWLRIYCVICGNKWDESLLLTPDMATPCDTSQIAVAANLIPDHHHAAIFFRSNAGDVRLLHFSGAHPVCGDAATELPEYLWVERTHHHPLLEMQLTQLCQFVDTYRSQIYIPYGFAFSPRSEILIP